MDGIRHGSQPITRIVRPVVSQPRAFFQMHEQKTLDGLVGVRKTLSDTPLASSRWMNLKKGLLTTWTQTRKFQWSWKGFWSPYFSWRPSSRQAFYFSLFSGVAFGVFVTAFSFLLFDRGVSAHVPEVTPLASSPTTSMVPDTWSQEEAGESQEDVFLEYFSEVAEEEYRAKITEMVAGHPIEAMLPYIFEKDRTVAAFLIGIAKKESNWGKRVPVLDGQDCFNYWGYRGVRRLMGTGGHTCFNSRKDAVDTVAKRIERLVYSEQLDTPEKMILWKCGFSCAGHSRESVKKWISDVDRYFSQLNDDGY